MKEGTERGTDQFAATMGLLLMLRCLDLGFCFTLGREDLFFFFWRTRPILSASTSASTQVEGGSRGWNNTSMVLLK